MFCTTSRLSQSARSWYTTSMPSAAESRGLWMWTDAAFPDDLAAIRRVDAGDALDQRGFAGAVVADEGGHLSRRRDEIDVGKGLHGAEALLHALDLEQRCGQACLRDVRSHGRGPRPTCAVHDTLDAVRLALFRHVAGAELGALTNSSLTTVEAMFFGVTQIGFRSTEATSLFSLLSIVDPLTRSAGGFSPARR